MACWRDVVAAASAGFSFRRVLAPFAGFQNYCCSACRYSRLTNLTRCHATRGLYEKLLVCGAVLRDQQVPCPLDQIYGALWLGFRRVAINPSDEFIRVPFRYLSELGIDFAIG